MADRDVILMRGVDSIDDFMKSADQRYIKLSQRIMEHGKLVYQFPDMCQLMETTKYHMSLLRPEYKRFRGAAEYSVVISPTIERARENIAKQFVSV
jgi:hypothetical protein